MAAKTPQLLIDKINKFPEERTNVDIAENLGIARSTVVKYRDRVEEKKQELVKEVLKSDLQQFLDEKGISKKDLDEMLKQKELSYQKEYKINMNPGHLKLGVVSDTHLSNKLCDIKSLQEFYKLCGEEKVDAMVHAGDVTDGIHIYPGQVFELSNIGFEEQLKYAAENYPKIEGVKTYAISGNHDEGRLKTGGINFLKSLSQLRDDIVDLGFYNGRVHINGFDIELQHGGGSSPYATSYPIQKFMERIPKQADIDLFVLGHYHREMFFLYRGMAALLPGAFLQENLLAKRFKLGNNIAAWIIEMKRDENGKVDFLPHLIKYK